MRGACPIKDVRIAACSFTLKLLPGVMHNLLAVLKRVQKWYRLNLPFIIQQYIKPMQLQRKVICRTMNH